MHTLGTHEEMTKDLVVECRVTENGLFARLAERDPCLQAGNLDELEDKLEGRRVSSGLAFVSGKELPGEVLV